MTKAAELAELDDDELQNRLASSRRELLNLRFQLATGQLDNTERLGEVKRDIARSLTILRERDLTEALVDLEPLVLTPARRVPLDETGGIDEDAEVEPDESEHDGVESDLGEPEASADDEDADDDSGDEEEE
jgi:large subunit ribosomal protein L29